MAMEEMTSGVKFSKTSRPDNTALLNMSIQVTPLLTSELYKPVCLQAIITLKESLPGSAQCLSMKVEIKDIKSKSEGQVL